MSPGGLIFLHFHSVWARKPDQQVLLASLLSVYIIPSHKHSIIVSHNPTNHEIMMCNNKEMRSHFPLLLRCAPNKFPKLGPVT